MKTKKIISGLLVSTFILSGIAFASSFTKTIKVTYDNIKIFVSGTEKKLSTQPFKYNNSVYVPLSAISDLPGSKATWDAKSNSVKITSTTNVNGLSSNYLYRQPYGDISSLTSGMAFDDVYDTKNVLHKDIAFKNATTEELQADKKYYHGIYYVTYKLDGKYSNLTGKLGIYDDDGYTNADATFKILDENNKVLYASQKYKKGMDWTNIGINISNVKTLKLEVEVRTVYKYQYLSPVFRDLIVK